MVVVSTSVANEVEQQRADHACLFRREGDLVHQVDLLDGHAELSQTLQGLAVRDPRVLDMHLLLIKYR